MKATPEITDPEETVIEFADAGPDSLGRRHFFAYWLDDNIGPSCDQHGVRGQVFFVDVAAYLVRLERRGRTARILPTASVAAP